jgi:hypothetical protein
LNWRVRCSTLTERTCVEVALTKFRDVPAAPEYRRDIAMLTRKIDTRIQILSDSAKALEVANDEILCFSVLDL